MESTSLMTTAYSGYPFKFHPNIFNTSSTKTQTNNNKQAMDSETVSLIQHGCNLARDLESNLFPNLANQQLETVARSLDDVMRVFGAARDRLQQQSAAAQHVDGMKMMSSYVHVAQQQQQIDARLQEWLRCNYPQAMEDHHHYIQTTSTQQNAGAEKTARDNNSGGEDVLLQVQGQIHQAMDHIVTVASNNAASSSQTRPRRRRDHGEIRKITVPAPRIGNTEIPPEDGFTWRKYGQKEIMGYRFPRGYYRCTHQKLYNCPAKKQAQRLDNDPFTFEVMYRGDHTCHMSSTAPSSLPPSDQIKQETLMTQSATASTTTTTPAVVTQPLVTWLSTDFNARGGGSSSGDGGRNDGDGVLGTSTTTTAATRYGKDVEFPVMDFADAMFNSGSSSSNSMDFMFTPSMDNKWESGDKKN